jgi:hypothetical protein
VLAGLVTEVRADPYAGPIYDRQHLPYVQPQADTPRPLLHPDLGPVWVYVCGSAIFGSPSARLMQLPLAPAGGEAAALGRLRARTPGEG